MNPSSTKQREKAMRLASVYHSHVYLGVHFLQFPASSLDWLLMTDQPRSEARQLQKSISGTLGGIDAKSGFNLPER